MSTPESQFEGVQTDPAPAAATSVRIVGIGASAGGLEAYTQLLKALSPDTGMAYVLVPHLSPTHHSELAHILSGVATLPVAQTLEGDVVAPNRVYIVPPDRMVTLSHGRLRLEARPIRDGDPTIIDRFLRSLAAEQGRRAIGVVLSGTGSDGTVGLQAIKAGGGTTYVQDPATAAHRGMPENALQAGCADFSLPPDAIARALARLAKPLPADVAEDGEAAPGVVYPSSAMALELGGEPEDWAAAATDPLDPELEALETIATLLQAATGVNFRQYKHATVARRIQRRLHDLRVPDLRAYVTLLRKDPSEIAILFETLLIHFTGFFREPETFEALQRVAVPALLEQRPADTPIRIWVVGCSTGQDAYSTAISLLEATTALGRDVPLQIFASDLSEPALTVARGGRYPDAISAQVSPERLARFFVAVDGGYRITERVRGMCVFARHDVTRDPPFSQLDLVLCRNLLIYLDPVLQRRVLHHLHYALKPRGFLALGSAERAGRFGELFAPVDGSPQLYRRRAVPTVLYVDFARTGVASSPRTFEMKGPAPLSRPSSAPDLQRAAEHALFTEYPAASVIINAGLEILHFQGRTSPYLEAPTGGPTAELLRMAHPDLRLVLGRLVRKAQQDRAPVRRIGVPIRCGAKSQRVNVTVLPFADKETGVQHHLVVFEPLQRAAGVGQGSTPEPPAEGARPELAEANEYLQTVIDQQ